MESSYYESVSNDNVETVIPDLNDDTTPTRKRKGKKTDSDSSTKESVVASFDTYTAWKTTIGDGGGGKNCTVSGSCSTLRASVSG